MRYDAIVLAAGKGKRADLGFNKVLYRMKSGRTVIETACDIFLRDEDCNKVILVTGDDIKSNNERLLVVEGGKERMDSVKNGLRKVESEYVLIHDGARPFLREEPLNELKKKVEETGAALLGKKVNDTVKIINGDKILNTIDRDIILLAETPQGFRSDLIKECYEKADKKIFTDDASLAEACGHEVSVVFDHYDNKKLTDREDFEDI